MEHSIRLKKIGNPNTPVLVNPDRVAYLARYADATAIGSAVQFSGLKDYCIQVHEMLGGAEGELHPAR